MKVARFLLIVFAISAVSPLLGYAIDYISPLTKIPARGIILLSPNEKGWFLFNPDGKGASLVKAGLTKSESYAITISYFPCPFRSENEFLVAIRKMNRATSKRFRLRTTTEELDPSHGPFFVNYYGLSEDYSPHQMPTGKDYALLEIMGFYARHPNNQNMVIKLEYSYRYYPGHEDPEFKKKANWVLTNATFTKQ